MRALRDGHLINFHGSVVHGGLHFKHFAETSGEGSESALELFLAKLAKNAFELGLGLLELLYRLQLVIGHTLANRVANFLKRFLHLLLCFFQLLGRAVGRVLRRWCLRLLVLLLLVIVWLLRTRLT